MPTCFFTAFFTLISIVPSLVSCTAKSTERVPGKVTGMVSVQPDFAAKLKPTDVLFIIARNQQVGPPSAVKRVTHPRFPLKYSIGPEDAMIPGTPGFEKNAILTLTARISRTGNAMPAAGDLEGVYANNPTRAGEGGVDITIDRERQ